LSPSRQGGGKSATNGKRATSGKGKGAAGGSPARSRADQGAKTPAGAALSPRDRYPAIADYAFISDCHSMALVNRNGSIDWCCMPRVDTASIFGRLLDWDRGGYCSVTPIEKDATAFQSYVEDTLVLSTTFRTEGGEAVVYDCLAMRRGGRLHPRRQLLRVIEGVRGRIDLRIEVCPRFDYGEVKPWIRRHGARAYSAIGGNDGVIVTSDAHLRPDLDEHSFTATVSVRSKDRVRLTVEFVDPASIEFGLPQLADANELDNRLEETIRWWRRWASQITLQGSHRSAVARSAIALKGLAFAPTGAIVAAATTSLPEAEGGERNWDYRFSWIRDSAFSVRSLADIGCTNEADGFRRFIQRSAAGSARDLQIMYGVGGERRLTEIVLPLDGWRGSRPVRIGNAASRQLQLDAYGTLLELVWRWHRRGDSPDDDYWRFIIDLVEVACDRWQESDRGIWEVRGEPQHFVHSKVMCWLALDRGLKLAEECIRKAPEARWQRVRDEIRKSVETKGYDSKRGVFVQAFGSSNLDAALLMLPIVGFIGYDDERMVRTVDAIRDELMHDGLVLRYRTEQTDDGLTGREGTFLACSFWLAEVLARQRRVEDGRKVFDRAASTSTELGLFSEEYDTEGDQMLGNFPQALTHLSHISAAVALSEQAGEVISRPY
jgi:GH15 family glucan-1,4-alpha-glucosidase